MLILNETNYSNGKVTLYDNENNVVSNGHVDVYEGINKVSTFSLDVYGQGTPSITAGIFYRFEVFDAVGELVSILEPVSLGESSSGGVTPAALEAETAARIASDESLQGQINSKVDKSYVDEKLGHIAYDKRVVDERLNNINELSYTTQEELISHISDKSNPHEVTAEQVGAYTKEQVDGFIRNWSGYVVIPFGQQKPSASDAQLGKIYLVQVSNDPDVRDQYEEWISDGTAWSLIGTMAIDLSPYDKIVDAEAREKAISDALAAHISDTTKHITEAERTKWNGKQDALSYTTPAEITEILGGLS